MTTFALYPIDKVRPHPRNVRRAAVATDEMVESIRSAGILEPVVLGPEVEDDGHTVRYLIAGNVRHDGALKAGLTTLPAVLRDDLATDAQQVEAMLVENLHRTDLTAVEEAEAYEQLQLFGMDVDAIAAATGRSKATVKARLEINDLPSKAREQIHSGEATLVDAIALLEFADDHEVQSQLESALGTPDFRWRIQGARDARVRAERNAKIVADFLDLGAAEADREATDDWKRLTSFWTKQLQDAAGHTHCECLGYVDHGSQSYGAPYLVCLDPESHADDEAATRASVGRGSSSTIQPDPEWQARREAAEKQAAERSAAAKVRLDHLTAVIRAALPTKGKTASTLAGATRAFLPALLGNSMIDDLIHADVLDHALGLDTTATGWHERHAQRVDHAVELTTATKDSTLLDALAQVLAVLIEEALTDIAQGGVNDYDRESDERAMASAAWEWLESTGHTMSDVDTQVRHLAIEGRPDEDGDD